MNMRKKLIFICVLFFFGRTAVKGQDDFAGPDKTICSGISTTLGVNASASYCYNWYAGGGDPFTSEAANPTVNPDKTTTYTVEVWNDDLSFYTKDKVTVFVANINKIEITPNICCWKRGDPVSLDQFTILTYPPNVEWDEIRFNPSTAPGGFVGFSGQKTVAFEFGCGTKHFTKNVPITVVDKEQEFGAANSDWNIEIGKLKNIFGGISNTLNDVVGRMQIPLVPCRPEGGVSFSAPGTSISYGKICCANTPDKCIRDNFRVNGLSISANAGLQCDIAPYPPLPIFLITFGGGLQAGLTFTPLGADEDCQADNRACTELAFSGNLFGGLALQVLTDEILRAQGVVNVTVSPFSTFKYCIPGGQDDDNFKLCGQVDAEASVTFMSFYAKKYKWSIVSKRCWP